MSFSDNLKENQMKHAETALLQTVFQDPNQTIGDIWEALEADAESEVMWDMFKKLTIGRLVTAGVAFAEGEMTRKPAPSASKTVKPASSTEEDEDEDEFEDGEDVDFDDEEDDEFEDDDDEEEAGEDDEEEDDEEDEEEDDEDEDEEEEAKKAKSRKKGKASSGKKGKTKSSKTEPKTLDLSSPESQKAYRHAIIKCLKANKARDKKSAMSSTDIRNQVDGDPKQFRDAVNELIESERVAFGGKARGMKYWLA